MALAITTTAADILTALACRQAGCDCVRAQRNGHGMTHCPCHLDPKPSLNITITRSGKLLVHCFGGCSQEMVVEALRARHLWPEGTVNDMDRTIAATFDYVDEAGTMLYQVVRFPPKDFRQRRPNGAGDWIWNLNGVRRVPYRLCEILAAISRGEPVFIVEGEKDTDRLVAAGFAATTNPGGAGKWRAEYNQYFKGAQVVIILDNDVPGRRHAQQVAQHLHDVARGVKIIDLPGLAPQGDVSDWLADGHAIDELQQLVNQAPPWRPSPQMETSTSTILPSFHYTDLGNAQRLVHQHGQDLRYCRKLATWFVWDGRRWHADETGEVFRRAKQTVALMYAEAARLSDTELRKTLGTWATRSEAADRIAAMVRLAETEQDVVVEAHQLDAAPYQLTCLNGTLDLRLGTLRPHRREDLITKLAPVDYDPTARLALWDETLAWALPDPDVRAFYQRAVGYSLTGDTREDKFFFVHGPTAALKSTINEAVKSALGLDYAKTADFETFLRRRDVGGPRNDIARLAGSRFVLSIEVEQGRRLAEGLIKAMTGGDTLAARFLFHESFEFRPTFTLWLVANHAPKVPDDDDAFWRRVVRIPFEHVLPEDQRDPAAKILLRTPEVAGPAILAWAVQGCLAWQQDGLRVPAIIKTATDAYRIEMDPMADFFTEQCEFGPDVKVDAGRLREAYDAWAKRIGEKPIVGKEYGRRLRARGCADGRTGEGRYWKGISLTTVVTS